METMQETKLRTSLKKCIQDWVETQHCDDPICYVGEHACSAMADAAFAVLQGMADLEEYFKKEGMLQ